MYNVIVINVINENYYELNDHLLNLMKDES